MKILTWSCCLESLQCPQSRQCPTSGRGNSISRCLTDWLYWGHSPQRPLHGELQLCPLIEGQCSQIGCWCCPWSGRALYLVCLQRRVYWTEEKNVGSDTQLQGSLSIVNTECTLATMCASAKCFYWKVAAYCAIRFLIYLRNVLPCISVLYFANL